MVCLMNNRTAPGIMIYDLERLDQLVLVDGSGIFRAFHGLPMMNRPDGTPINVVFGFTKMLLKLKADLNQPYYRDF